MNLLASATYTSATGTNMELQWLHGVLLLRVPNPAQMWQFWLKTHVNCPFLHNNRFPTGLLGYVCQQAVKDGYDLNIAWALGAGTLPATPIKDCTFPPQFQIRGYQQELVQEALTVGRGIIRAATASGKTGMMAMILKALGIPPALVLVSGRALVKQTVEELSAWLETPVGEVSSLRRNLRENVVVALAQSLAACSDEPWFKMFMDSRGVLMCDEAHHVAVAPPAPRRNTGTFSVGAEESKKITGGMWYELAMACAAPNRYGLSATPLKLADPIQNWRLIGATGPLIKGSITSTDLIQQGYAACPYIMFAPYKTAHLPKKGNNYAEIVDKGIVNCYERNVLLVEAAKTTYKLGIKTLILVERKEHGKILEAMVAANGLPVKFIDGAQDQLKQEELLAWFRTPGEKILVSTRVLGEGTNIPDIGAIIYGRGGKAFVNFFQSIGRGVRLKADGPNVCLVILPDDKHNPWLKKHVEMLRTYLAAEEGYRVALQGQSVQEFCEAVIEGCAQTASGEELLGLKGEEPK